MNDHRIRTSLINPTLFREIDRRRRPKIIPTPIATPVREIMGMPAAKYFMPNRMIEGEGEGEKER